MGRRPRPSSRRSSISVAVRARNRALMAIHRASGGRAGARYVQRAPLCLLTTRDRSTGRTRIAPMPYVRAGEDVVLGALVGGVPEIPEWYKNLRQNPIVGIRIGARVRTYTARPATPDEAVQWAPRLSAAYGDERYPSHRRRRIRVVVCHIFDTAQLATGSDDPEVIDLRDGSPRRRGDGADAGAAPASRATPVRTGPSDGGAGESASDLPWWRVESERVQASAGTSTAPVPQRRP